MGRGNKKFRVRILPSPVTQATGRHIANMTLSFHRAAEAAVVEAEVVVEVAVAAVEEVAIAIAVATACTRRSRRRTRS